MKRILRLVVVLGAVLGGAAWAAITPTTGYQPYSGTVNGPVVGSVEAACQAAVPFAIANPVQVGGSQVKSLTSGKVGSTCNEVAVSVLMHGTMGNPEYPFECDVDGCNFGRFTVNIRTITQSCPANSTLVNGACQCNANFQENPGQTLCIPAKGRWEKACEDNTGKRYFFRVDGKSLPGGCQTGINMVGSPIEGDTGGLPESFGCAVRFVDDGEILSAQDAAGKWVTQGTARVTGETCVASGTGGVPNDAPPGTEEDNAGNKDPCPNGDQGAVNGITRCVPHVPDAGVEGTSQATRDNGDGTTTRTNQTIKCEKGVCTTTTTTTTTSNSTGNTISSNTTSTSASQGQTCKENPASKVCQTATGGGGGGAGGDGEASEWSGNCAGGFTCEGDAIQCAMAKEQHKVRCEYESLNAPWKFTEVAEPTKANIRGDAEEDVDASSWLAFVNTPADSAACPAGKAMELMGRSYTLSMQPLCDVGEGIRPFVLAIAVLLGLRVFMRAVLGGA